jgi:hypothetical protein
MGTRNFALVIGIAFLAAGVLGWIPGVTQMHHGPDYLLGIFPVNALHNWVHVVIGVWGISASRAFLSARAYAKSLAVIYGVLAVLGVIPNAQTLWGLTPLFGADVGLHALTAVAAAYFGFSRERIGTRPSVAGRQALES